MQFKLLKSQKVCCSEMRQEIDIIERNSSLRRSSAVGPENRFVVNLQAFSLQTAASDLGLSGENIPN